MATSNQALDNTLGAALIGLVVASVLNGVSIVQAWYYFGHCQKDSVFLRLLVAAVMCFDTVHEVLITHTLYTYTVTDWGKPEKLERIVWSLLVEVIFNGLTAFLVQSYLTRRVWLCTSLRSTMKPSIERVSTGKKVLTAAVIMLVLGEFGCVIAFTVMSLHLHTFEQLAKLKSLSILVNALAAAGDVLIAGTLCSLLHSSRTGFRGSDTIINRLILFSVNTGVLTSLCAIASLISIIVAGNTFLYIAFFFCIGRLYTNSLLATLNARKSIRNSGEGVHSTSDNITLPTRNPLSLRRPTNISIKIDTTKEYARDLYHDNDLDKAEVRMAGIQHFIQKCRPAPLYAHLKTRILESRRFEKWKVFHKNWW